MNYKVYSVYIPNKKARLKYFASKKRAINAAKVWAERNTFITVAVEEYVIEKIYSDDDLINSLRLLFADIEQEIARKQIVFEKAGII